MISSPDKSLQKRLEALYKELKVVEAIHLTQKILMYRPNPYGDQKRFFEEQNATIRLVKGDNRAGKSVLGVVEAISHSLGYRPWLDENDPLRIVRLPGGKPIPVPNVGRVLAQDFQQAVKQNIWEKVQEWAPRGWYTIKKNPQGVPTEVRWKNGSIWYLMSDEQDDMVFEGTRGHWFWVDEPCGYKKFVALKRGLVDYGGHCWMTLTPLTQPWIADVIDSRAGDPDGEVVALRLRIEDNEISRGGYLEQAAIDSFIADLRPDEKAARVGGEWMHLTGRVFPQWRPVEPFWVRPFKVPDTWPRVCVIDPHPNKPIAVLWAAVTPDEQWFVYRELFDENLTTVEDVAERIKELEAEAKETIAIRLIDPASKERERTSGTNIKDEFGRHGVWCIDAPKRNLNVGINAIREALKLPYEWSEPSLVVFNNCPTVKRNFQRFVWADWRSSRERDLKGPQQKVLAIEDDMIACIRYFLQMGLDYWMLRREQKRLEEMEQEDKRTGEYHLWQTY